MKDKNLLLSIQFRSELSRAGRVVLPVKLLCEPRLVPASLSA